MSLQLATCNYSLDHSSLVSTLNPNWEQSEITLGGRF